jgi:molybdopterin-guanine dinucleotide biosynthesis protein A
MAPFTVCTAVDASTSSNALHRATRHWDAQQLEQILVGETDLQPHPKRVVRAEVASTSRDEPALAELLRLAAEEASHDWLLLVPSDALLTPALVDNLAQLCRPGSPRRLVIGRAWRLPEAELPINDAWDLHLDRSGKLDPAGAVAWLLLPRGTLLAAPTELSCCPAAAASWLIHSAEQLGWPVLDASAAAPLVRPVAAEVAQQPSWAPSSSPASGVVLPHRPGAPLLSLLLAAPQAQLDQLSAALCPCPSLPWEVVARPVDTPELDGELAAAWNSALDQCHAAIAWPISHNRPPLALLPVLLRCFEQPAVELVQLGPLPTPGALVIQTAWLRRLGGLAEQGSAAEAFNALEQNARRRGACCLNLPLPACASTAGGAATAA